MVKTLEELNQHKEALARYVSDPPKSRVFIRQQPTKTQKVIIKVLEDGDYDIAITLVYKKSYNLDSDHLRKLFKLKSRKKYIDSDEAIYWAKKWVNKIRNKYGNIKLIGVKERVKRGTHTGCYHYHIAIKELPDPNFRQDLIDTWNNLFDGVQPAFISHQKVDSGWGEYMSKKDGDLDIDISRF